MMIVAAASLFYENDMCVRIRLVDIYTPDSNCGATSAFAYMPRDKACGSGATSETFIRYFADWMNKNRNTIGFNQEAVHHAFTGYPPAYTLGCGYFGTACRSPNYAYGIEYMSSYFLSSQSVIFAHELGHNLGARHLTTAQAAGKRYIMKPSLQNPNDGFSELTIQSVLGFLESSDVTCDDVEYPMGTHEPSSALTSPQTPVPSGGSPPPSCGLEQSTGTKTCFLASNSGLFGCADLQTLVSVKPNIFCASQNPIITRIGLRSCEEMGTNGGAVSNNPGRHLRTKKVKINPNHDARSELRNSTGNNTISTAMEMSYESQSNNLGL